MHIDAWGDQIFLSFASGLIGAGEECIMKNLQVQFDRQNDLVG